MVFSSLEKFPSNSIVSLIFFRKRRMSSNQGQGQSHGQGQGQGKNEKSLSMIRLENEKRLSEVVNEFCNYVTI